MPPHPLRLNPGDDLRLALEAWSRPYRSAFVIAGIGSLHDARIRWAGAAEAETVEGPLEIISLSGSLSPDGAHLHIAVADAQGQVRGGHLAAGSRVRTTAEVLVADLPGWQFRREQDAGTGYPELVIHPRRHPG
ncbi:PPC domain-containing DNA-binding protein [Leptothrix discophora]|uniref:DNA-binding protein n=1 Tax=Leptothrix discophora TaxID=89 RepID=A0ABT9FYX1_LEPDI|nr:PPC domain-containing DNA-binding protein [Leptothrix discophora]MDP4299340.1 DNA-binding protein [Leptothrix discophora]